MTADELAVLHDMAQAQRTGMTQQQMTHQEARRKEAEDAVETLYDFMMGEETEPEDVMKALEFLSWEAGVLDFYKRLRSE